MQEALLRLSEYWASHGFLIWQPMNTEVGAGTLNPATALRVLGPEPWRVGYVEPSVRPDDSRYGENPNRLQTHTQYQVIIKPEPGNAQELYLGSLQALGIDLAAHDIRFVEDNWAAPGLGAWGLGWEVWLDGMEITQWTYFQQAGGHSLDPVSVEITYGIERIMMFVQGVTHFKDITYAPGLSYGEVLGQSELENSTYYLDTADIGMLRRLFEAYEVEARRQIDAGLALPAHSYILKCSHAFNILDSRNAIGTTERARAFARMRSLSHDVAELWIRRREEMGHPLGIAATLAAPEATTELPTIDVSTPFVFEIGVEEMPASEVDRAVETVREGLTQRLAATRLRHSAIKVVGTPRRVVALIDEVAPAENDFEQTIRGPRLSAAYDAAGSPTPAALGFARSQNVDVSDLMRFSSQGGEYVGITRQVTGRSAASVLAEILPDVVTSLRAEKNMRWNAPGLSFSRPIRWLVALLGDQPLPITVANIVSGRLTRLDRTSSKPIVSVPTAHGYLEFLAQHKVLVDAGERQNRIVAESERLASSVEGLIDTTADKGVIDEVTHLVEWPTAILGQFDRSYLALPHDVLITVMKKHQRYLPVRDSNGSLLPYFVAIANGDCDVDTVRHGNEAVLQARYEDAAFFFNRDLQIKPEDMKTGLASLTFEERLGSMADRARRIGAIAVSLSGLAEVSSSDADTVLRAAPLAKFDLASSMVIELSSLAGVMAREYARGTGHPDAVAEALFEMELPRYAGDLLPSTTAGAILALADRFDLLTGLFALGYAPTGRSDPFGLRRAALGVLSILRARPELGAVSVSTGLRIAAGQHAVEVSPSAREEAQQFLTRRFEQQLLENGASHSFVRAVLPLADTPARAELILHQLITLRSDPRSPFDALVQSMQRIRRIVPPETQPEYHSAALQEKAEQNLHTALGAVQAELAEEPDLSQFVSVASNLIEPIDQFFVDVLVMAEDPEVRANRLGLLAAVRDLGADLIDWDALN